MAINPELAAQIKQAATDNAPQPGQTSVAAGYRPAGNRGALTGEQYQDYRPMIDQYRGHLQQTAKEGMGTDARIAARQRYMRPAMANMRAGNRALAAQQGRSGVRGGAAFAQGDAIRNQALQAMQQGETAITLEDQRRRDLAEQGLGQMGFGERGKYQAEMLRGLGRQDMLAGQEANRGLMRDSINMQDRFHQGLLEMLKPQEAAPPPVQEGNPNLFPSGASGRASVPTGAMVQPKSWGDGIMEAPERARKWIGGLFD